MQYISEMHSFQMVGTTKPKSASLAWERDVKRGQYFLLQRLNMSLVIWRKLWKNAMVFVPHASN